MKRPNGRAQPKRQGGKGRSEDLFFVLKVLMPEALAAGVIGKGGAVITSIRESTGASLSLSEHHELYPGTECRICTARASTEDALVDVCKQVIAKLAECVEAGPSESLGLSDQDLRLKALLPRAAVSGLIGKGGAAITRLREQSGARVSVSEPDLPGPSADQVVTISGTQEALESVMEEVNKQVQALSWEPWFSQWAGSTSYAGPDLITTVAQSLPEYVMHDERGFAMSCVVPSHLVGGLIGRGGSGTKEVQTYTGAKIAIREIPGDAEHKTLNISGPLANTCAAYMLMMKRYLDAEAQ